MQVMRPLTVSIDQTTAPLVSAVVMPYDAVGHFALACFNHVADGLLLLLLVIVLKVGGSSSTSRSSGSKSSSKVIHILCVRSLWRLDVRCT